MFLTQVRLITFYSWRFNTIVEKQQKRKLFKLVLMKKGEFFSNLNLYLSYFCYVYYNVILYPFFILYIAYLFVRNFFIFFFLIIYIPIYNYKAKTNLHFTFYIKIAYLLYTYMIIYYYKIKIIKNIIIILSDLFSYCEKDESKLFHYLYNIAKINLIRFIIYIYITLKLQSKCLTALNLII